MCFIQDGSTPLMTASFNGHVDIVRILIEAQAQVNIQTKVYVHYNLLKSTDFTLSHNFD